jgi:eukaryotic-like serine/threonine-protein kinase
MIYNERQQLGNYRLLRRLGSGDFADVYLGEHVLLETPAAIKILHTQWTNVGKEDFLAEAKRLMRLNHPHIVRVLEFGIQGNISYLIMEYAPNGSLKDHHAAASSFPLPLPVGIVVSYAQQIASALQYLHDHKLIHRDVKPANILLGSNNTLLLSDIGLLSSLDSPILMFSLTQASSRRCHYTRSSSIRLNASSE